MNEKEHSSIGTCFIISALGDPGSKTRLHADKAKEYIITPAAIQMGFDVLRSDDISDSGIITNQIIQHLLDDKIVVADLTGHNPNVFYELALRHAAEKPFAHLISKGEKPPFDIAHARAIEYDFEDPKSVREARTRLESNMRDALDNKSVESPVTVTARLRNIQFFKAPDGDKENVLTQMVRQYDEISSTVADIKNILHSPGILKDAIPSFVRDQMESMLRRYSNEIELLKAVRDGGIVGVSRRRSAVVEFLKSAIDEEETEIMVIGSSLKGLLQNNEYTEIRNKLMFKSKIPNFQLRFLLTHPVFADFRARQEHREIGHIGREIIASLGVLKQWGLDPKNVRLYLGTPTSFAIKTTRKMLINPYPYRAQAFESPCIMVRSEKGSDVEYSYYFFDHFNDAHFGAWDTNLAVKIESYETALIEFERGLESYSETVAGVIAQVKQKDSYR
jgi:hypothetical protein